MDFKKSAFEHFLKGLNKKISGRKEEPTNVRKDQTVVNSKRKSLSKTELAHGSGSKVPATKPDDPRFQPWCPRGGRREPTLASSSLSTTHAYWGTGTPHNLCMHKVKAYIYLKAIVLNRDLGISQACRQKMHMGRDRVQLMILLRGRL